ncbi:hypothetical protein [Micromonospora globbae]|uniref:hypothetical protein n=1 Tax=Micromonospora globbae TaxID=1894969 RepID=UPI001F021C5E|nr:hypothetical protein [Micromonospora globbae]
MVAVLAALAIVAGPTPATAAPTTPTPSGHEEDNEPKLITDVIDAANRGYVQAKAKLHKSRKRQLQLALEVRTAQADLDALAPQVSQLAAQSWLSCCSTSAGLGSAKALGAPRRQHAEKNRGQQQADTCHRPPALMQHAAALL